MRTALTTFALLCASAQPAFAQEPLELGVIRNDDIHVVQKNLYPKTDRTEIGVHLGVMPFDAYVWTPNAQLSFNSHMSESMAVSVVAGGGYGFKTGAYRTMESPAYGVAPYAYRYLGSVIGGLEWSPIYAKMNLNGAKVLHFDIYGAARAGVSVEQSVLPDGSITIAPTLSPAIGSRVFLGQNTTARLELRDDVLLENRTITQSWHIKQNANVTFGLTFLSPVKGR